MEKLSTQYVLLMVFLEHKNTSIFLLQTPNQDKTI